MGVPTDRKSNRQGRGPRDHWSRSEVGRKGQSPTSTTGLTGTSPTSPDAGPSGLGTLRKSGPPPPSAPTGSATHRRQSLVAPSTKVRNHSPHPLPTEQNPSPGGLLRPPAAGTPDREYTRSSSLFSLVHVPTGLPLSPANQDPSTTADVPPTDSGPILPSPPCVKPPNLFKPVPPSVRTDTGRGASWGTSRRVGLPERDVGGRAGQGVRRTRVTGSSSSSALSSDASSTSLGPPCTTGSWSGTGTSTNPRNRRGRSTPGGDRSPTLVSPPRPQTPSALRKSSGFFLSFDFCLGVSFRLGLGNRRNGGIGPRGLRGVTIR